jgi:CheY-like chemotaxis protein
MRRTILIAEAVELNREMLAEILRDDYEIIMASDGEAATEIIKEKI